VKISKIISVAAAFLSLVAGNASAQTPETLVRDVMEDARESCVTVTYALSAVIDDVRIQDEGSVVAQGESWVLKGRNVEIYTNEEGTWIMSPESMEAMVEPKWTYDDLEAFYKTLLSASAGNNVSVRILSKTLSEQKPASFFQPVTDGEWVVTDLR
jgi:hypothetical protein